MLRDQLHCLRSYLLGNTIRYVAQSAEEFDFSSVAAIKVSPKNAEAYDFSLFERSVHGFQL